MLKKSKGSDFAQFWSKPSEAVWNRWETAKRLREIFFVRFLSKMWYLLTKNMKGMTVKVENLQRGQAYPALEKTSKQFFWLSPPSWCKYLPNIIIHWNHRTKQDHQWWRYHRMRHWQLIRSKLGFYFSSGKTLDIDIIFLWSTSYWSIEDKTYKKVERNPF